MQGLRTTIYKVDDITKAKEWYAKAFLTQPYFDEPFYVGFDIGGFELGLQPDNTGYYGEVWCNGQHQDPTSYRSPDGNPIWNFRVS